MSEGERVSIASGQSERVMQTPRQCPECGRLVRAGRIGDRVMCLRHPERGSIAETATCWECDAHQRRWIDAVEQMISAAEGWMLETGPGQHVNTAKGRADTKRALDRINDLRTAIDV